MLHLNLPDDFVLSTYYAASRDMLAQQPNKKSKSKVKKVLTGNPAENYRVKGLHEPTLDLRSLNKAQLMAEVLKRDEEVTLMYQELINFAALKSANKRYALELAAAEVSATVFLGSLEELHNLVSDKEALLEKAEVLTTSQAEVMASTIEAKDKDKQSIGALDPRLSEAVTMHKQKKDTINDMQVVEYQPRGTVLTITRQAEADAEGVSDCWKKPYVKGGTAENYEKRRRKSTLSRKVEQAAQTHLQQELDIALETVNRLKSEARDTSLEDIYTATPPIGQL